jgi:hypothetical protein
LLQGAGEELALAVVWIDVLASDDADAADRAQVLLDDGRVTHFHDPEQIAGKAWAPALEVDLAWDVYLLFDERVVWGDVAPMPHTWFHQLGSSMADPARRKHAHDLANALHSASQTIGWPSAPAAPLAAHWDTARAAAMGRLAEASGDVDDRCDVCRAERELSPCSLGGWRRMVLGTEGDGSFMASGSVSASAADGRRVVRLDVRGMRCPECMLRAGMGALAHKGVREIEVDLDQGFMVIQLAPEAMLTGLDLAMAVSGQGFTAEVASP